MSSIEALAKRIESLGSPAMLREITGAMAGESATLYRKGFDKKVDPYGKLWPPRKEQIKKRSWRQTGSTLMVKSGDLRDDVRIEADHGYFRLDVQMPYGVFHQFGTDNMVSRKIVPDAATGLGNWGAPLKRKMISTLRGLLK